MYKSYQAVLPYFYSKLYIEVSASRNLVKKFEQYIPVIFVFYFLLGESLIVLNEKGTLSTYARGKNQFNFDSNGDR